MGREREEKTMRAMVEIFCQDHHQVERGALCDSCTTLMNYALARLGKCPWGDEKPVCANCSVHCYKPAMRDSVRTVMRYAGPKMLLRHPLLAVSHLVQKQKAAPTGRPAPTAPLPDPPPTPATPPFETDPRN